MSDPVGLLRPVFFLAALLFVGAVVVRTIHEAAYQRHQVEKGLRMPPIEDYRRGRCREEAVYPTWRGDGGQNSSPGRDGKPGCEWQP